MNGNDCGKQLYLSCCIFAHYYVSIYISTFCIYFCCTTFLQLIVAICRKLPYDAIRVETKFINLLLCFYTFLVSTYDILEHTLLLFRSIVVTNICRNPIAVTPHLVFSLGIRSIHSNTQLLVLLVT